jgi:Pentapeptide repeats (8 copies)
MHTKNTTPIVYLSIGLTLVLLTVAMGVTSCGAPPTPLPTAQAMNNAEAAATAIVWLTSESNAATREPALRTVEAATKIAQTETAAVQSAATATAAAIPTVGAWCTSRVRPILEAGNYSELLTPEARLYLTGCDLSKLNLYRLDLSYSDLSYANLSDANLEGTDLRYADLQHADLSRARLQGADLSYADLREANCAGANLSDVNFTGALTSPSCGRQP